MPMQQCSTLPRNGPSNNDLCADNAVRFFPSGVRFFPTTPGKNRTSNFAFFNKTPMINRSLFSKNHADHYLSPVKYASVTEKSHFQIVDMKVYEMFDSSPN
jgi:hypothetical protein